MGWPCLTLPPPCRLHPPHRADGPRGEERRGHHLPHQGGLHRLLRPEAGHPGEPRLLLPPRAGQPPRRPAQAWHHPHQEEAGGNHLRLSPRGWCSPLGHPFGDSRATEGRRDFVGCSFPQTPGPGAARTADSRDWGRDCPETSPVCSHSLSLPSPWTFGAAGGFLGAGSSLPPCSPGRVGVGILALVCSRGCPWSCVPFLPFLAKPPSCRNKPAAALPDVASPCSLFLWHHLVSSPASPCTLRCSEVAVPLKKEPGTRPSPTPGSCSPPDSAFPPSPTARKPPHRCLRARSCF